MPLSEREEPSSGDAPSPQVARIVHWLLRYRIWILISCLFFGLFAVPRTARTYAALKSDLEELLPGNAPSVGALSALRERLPGMRYLGVVVDTGSAENLPEAVRFIDDLARRVERYPKELVSGVRTGFRDEREFAETYALQLADLEDVRELRRALESRRDWEVTRALDLDLLDDQEDPKPDLPLETLRQKYKARYGGGTEFGLAAELGDMHFVDADGRTALLLIEGRSTSTGAGPDKELITRVREDIDDLGFPEAYAPGLVLGLAGDVAARVEEMEGLQVDLTVSAFVVSLLIVLLLTWFFGSAWSLPLLGIPLLLGTAYAFALVALPPWSIRSLNSNTAFLGSIVIGDGVNTGIMLLARVQEARSRGALIVPSIVEGVSGVWRPTLAANLAGATAYGSLIFTDFRGFNQFGWIGGLGMVFCWIVTMLLLPILLSYFGERLPATSGRHRPRLGRGVLLGMLARPRAVVSVTMLLAVVSAVGIAERMGGWMEYDFAKLRRRDSWVSGERYWGPRMDETLGRYLTPTVVLAKDAPSADIVRERIEKIRLRGGAGGLIDSVRTAQDILRPERFQSVEEIAKIAGALTPRMLAELKPNDRALVEKAVSVQAQKPLSAEDLPEVFVAGLRELDGRIDRNVLVFPKLHAGTWESRPISEFTSELREAAAVNGHAQPVAGSLLLSSDITEAMRRSGPPATALALGVVVAVCFFAFRSGSKSSERIQRPLWLSTAAVSSVLLGVLLMMGAMAFAGVRINFTNFVALPITFGIGADYSINMLRRWQSEGESYDMGHALASTGGAVALCSLTTTIGFGSLLMAQNRMLFSFGVMAVAGEVACMMTAVLVLPSALRLIAPPQRMR